MEKQWYECDPNKNVNCRKSLCIHNPNAKHKICDRTSNIKFATDSALKEIHTLNKEDVP